MSVETDVNYQEGFKDPKVVLEIGVQGKAYYTRSWANFNKETDKYYAFNIHNSFQDLDFLNESMEKNKVKGGVIQADGGRIPLPNGSVDEVVLDDVLTSFRVPNPQFSQLELLYQDKEGKSGMTTFSTKEQILNEIKRIFAECLRVLKPMGQILLVTNNVGDSRKQFPKFIDELIRSGEFSISKESQNDPIGTTNDFQRSEIIRIKRN